MLSLSKQQVNQMIEHCKKGVPAEACGLLAGKGGEVLKVYQMTNIDESNKRYLADPKEQFTAFKRLRDEGMELLGIFHSHVATPAYPSATDIDMALYDVSYFIVSLMEEKPVIKAFNIIKGKVEEQEFTIVES